MSRTDTEEFSRKMHVRFLTHFTTVIVFVLTCFLTANVVANERELAPLLTPDAWKLLTDADALSNGFKPTKVTASGLTPRTPSLKPELIKLPNSRVMVKFADDLQIRLDVHNKPYSRTHQASSTEHNPSEGIAALCETLGVTLAPTVSKSQAGIDAVILEAELASGKQQPDIGGIYWVNGPDSAVDVAAELFYTMEEVEWVFYKPVYSKMPKSAPQYDFTPVPSTPSPQPTKKVKPKDTIFGACIVNRTECIENLGKAACYDQNGTFLGPNSVCVQKVDIQDSRFIQDPSRANLGPTGECCIPSTCVIVAAEVNCTDINGIFLGFDTNTPPTPCGASQTDCPTPLNGGPIPFDDYNKCADDGEVTSFLTGDCYIDQTVLLQTNRVGGPSDGVNPAPPAGPPFPAGCVDTRPVMADSAFAGSAGLATDFCIITGMPSGAGTSVFTGSTCCETIINDVPQCDPEDPAYVGGWNALCASYAQAYAVAGTDCLRGPAVSNGTVSNCFNPFGPTQNPPAVQPTIVMANVGNASQGIVLSNNGAFGANLTASFTITDPDADGCTDGNCFLDLIVNAAAPHTTINLTSGTTLTALAAAITGAANGWTGTVTGAGDLRANSLAAVPNTQTWNVAFTNPSVPQSITSVPISPNSGCLSALGPPSFPRAAATPDYSSLGLLTWMTPQVSPWVGAPLLGLPAQLLALPSSSTNLTTNQIGHVNKLLPWPMGGATIGVAPTSSTIPSILSPMGASGIGWFGGDGGVDLFPNAPNPGGFGGAEVYLGSYGYGQLWADDGVGTNGSFGNNVQVAVLDWSAHLQQRSIVDEFGSTVNLGGIHEEFRANGLATNTTDVNGNTIPTASTVILEGTATGHNPLTLLFDENLPFGYSADHGTAVLGVIGANWSTTSPLPGAPAYPPTLTQRLTGIAGITPNVGTLGLAPDATLFFFPLATATAPDREQDAWLNAIETLDAGDIICAAYRPVAISGTQPNLNYWPDTALYLQLANNKSIVTVLRAGDQGIDLAGLEFPNGDQNAIVATAVTPGSSSTGTLGPPFNPGAPVGYKRFCTSTQGSNFTAGTVQDYSSGTVSSWGMGIVTCGKGPLRDNYLGYNTIAYATGATPYPSPTSDPHIVNGQAYTNNFGTTGGAAAVAAGCVAQLQGFTKQVFGIPMGPVIARQLIAGGKYEGVNQDGTPILTNAPMITTEVGRDSECEVVVNNLDWDFCVNPDGSGNLTGNLVDPRNSMINAILNPIFDTPNIDNFVFIRGNQFVGNMFSIAAIDGNLLGATPVKTRAHIPYNAPPMVPGSPVRYLGNGLTTDLFLTGVLESNIPMNNNIAVNVTLFPIQQSSLFLQLQMFDQQTGRWRQAAATTVLAQGDTNVQIQVENASTFISASTSQYALRLITLDINTPNGGPTAVFPILYDQVTVSTGFIQH